MPESEFSPATSTTHSKRAYLKRGRPSTRGKIQTYIYDEKADELLWYRLRNMNCHGLRFKHNFILDNYFTNFLCHARRLAIEIRDDRQMADRVILRNGSRKVGALYLQVLRFSNSEVLEQTNMVEREIIDALQ